MLRELAQGKLWICLKAGVCWTMQHNEPTHKCHMEHSMILGIPKGLLLLRQFETLHINFPRSPYSFTTKRGFKARSPAYQDNDFPPEHRVDLTINAIMGE
jgi:hypothetical protein